MLIENVNGTRRASSMMKNSSFYIEVAKFVQAYRTIIANPNEFLREIKAPLIDEENDKISWEQFVQIVQKCDLGFKIIPTREELVAYYNYALEIGTINANEKRFATVDDVADAQKHYYNFVDEATDKAEEKYLRQHRTAMMRQREYSAVGSHMVALRTKNIIAVIFMFLAGFMGAFAVASFILNNAIAEAIGSIIPIWEKQYVGAIVLLVLAVFIFWLFDKLYILTKREYIKLRSATATIFAKNREIYLMGQDLKRKFEALKKDLKTVQAEIHDKTKKHDVKHNIEVLKLTNKYYKRLCEFEEELSSTLGGDEMNMAARTADGENEFAPIKLTKEQTENLKRVSKEAIRLEGQFDVDAYNEKFEKSTRKPAKEEKTVEETEKEADVKTGQDIAQVLQDATAEKVSTDLENAEKALNEEVQEEQEEKENQEELESSIDYIKSILGFGLETPQNDAEKEK